MSGRFTPVQRRVYEAVREAADAAFAAATHVIKHRLTVNRVAPSPIENRTTNASYDAATDRWTVMAGREGADERDVPRHGGQQPRVCNDL